MSQLEDEMIAEIIRTIETELSVKLPADAFDRARLAVAQRFGGAEVYVAKSPKLATHARIVAMGTSLPAVEVAKQIGVTATYVRQVRRLMRKP